MLGGQPTGRGRLYKDMMDNKQVSIMLELQNCNNIKKGTDWMPMQIKCTCEIHNIVPFEMTPKTVIAQACWLTALEKYLCLSRQSLFKEVSEGPKGRPDLLSLAE